MKRPALSATTLTRCEFATAILLTIVLVAAHLLFFFHAGPLWRDEISSLALATKPTFSEFWTSLKFDPFPASYFLVLRLWHALFGESDLALRGLGLLTGLILIGSLWLGSYPVDRSAPIWPLALFAFNPLVLEAGDSLRPYGFGLIWIVLAFAFMAQLVFGVPGKIVAACVFVAAVLSVQFNFTNALVLFSLITGAVLVLLRTRAWLEISLVLAAGMAAALSLLPYLLIMKATSEWSKILANENYFVGVIAVARDAIASSGVVAEWMWLALVTVLICAGSVAFICNRPANDRRRGQVIFAAIVFLVAAGGTLGFLCAAKYLVFPRYFLAILAIGGLCVDIFWNAIAQQTAIRVIGLCLGLIVAVTSLHPLFERAQTRMTNCDQIAAMLEQRAAPDDFIIVTSPLYGISFQRYYHGRASWMTLPPIDDLTLHRWDLIKKTLAEPDPAPELLARAQNALQAGHKIFLVGKLGPAPAIEPESLPPAPQSQFGWKMETYTNQWKSELTYWFEHHALHGTNLPVDQEQSVNPLEQLGLFEISGLREL
jgi:hypothetical protein